MSFNHLHEFEDDFAQIAINRPSGHVALTMSLALPLSSTKSPSKKKYYGEIGPHSTLDPRYPNLATARRAESRHYRTMTSSTSHHNIGALSSSASSSNTTAAANSHVAAGNASVAPSTPSYASKYLSTAASAPSSSSSRRIVSCPTDATPPPSFMRQTSASLSKQVASPFVTPKRIPSGSGLSSSTSSSALSSNRVGTGLRRSEGHSAFHSSSKLSSYLPLDITNVHNKYNNEESPSKKQSLVLKQRKVHPYYQLRQASVTKPTLLSVQSSLKSFSPARTISVSKLDIVKHTDENYPPQKPGQLLNILVQDSNVKKMKTDNKIPDLESLFALISDKDPTLFLPKQEELIELVPKTPSDYMDDPNYQLNVYEKGEIIRKKHIYYMPKAAASQDINISNHNLNYGFDNEQGNYILKWHDHINYRYEIQRIIGNGSFGNVAQCLDHKNGQVVAVKIIRNAVNWSVQSINEINMLKTLQQEELLILKYFDHFHFRNHLCIVTELMLINLYTLLELTEFRGLSLGLVKQFCNGILKGLKYIHSQNIIHCDIKPENIMIKLSTLEENRSPDLELKIIDFGSSCYLNEIMFTYIQSRFYRAPEILLGANYDCKIDIWSFGCVVAELFTSKPILPGQSELEQAGLILEYFGPPLSSTVLQMRSRLIHLLKTQRLKNSAANGGKMLDGINNSFKTSSMLMPPSHTEKSDSQALKRTLLYTLFDTQGRVNLQSLNLRLGQLGVKSKRLGSKPLMYQLRILDNREQSAQFVQFLEAIFKWDPNERASVDELLQQEFMK